MVFAKDYSRPADEHFFVLRRGIVFDFPKYAVKG